MSDAKELNVRKNLNCLQTFRDNTPSHLDAKRKLLEAQFALGIENNDCEDLEKRKFYQILFDEEAARDGYLRGVDESQEDYLYPASYFIFVELPSKVQEVLVATVR